MPVMSASALLFAYGPEIRSFISGGLAKELAAQGPVVAITVVPRSAELLRQEFHVIEFAREGGARWEHALRRYVTSIVERRLELQGESKWRHQIAGAGRKAAWKEFVKSMLAARIPLKLLTVMERLVSVLAPVDMDLKYSLQAYGVTRLYYSAYNDARTNLVVRTAQSIGIQTIAIPNSWKDVYVRPRISPLPSELYVWDEETRARFLSLNPDLAAQVVKVRPSLHLAAVVRQKGRMDRQTFCRRFGLEAQRPFVCYTTAARTAVVEEERIVRALAESLQGVGIGGVQLLVRVNPMEIGTRYEDALSELPGVAVQRPLWEWWPEDDWCAASDQDTLDWAATLEHMHLNVSVCSTVTLEVIEFGRQVLNVGFDSRPSLPPESSVIRFWHAPFYRRFHGHPAVRLEDSLEDLVEAIEESLPLGSRRILSDPVGIGKC